MNARKVQSSSRSASSMRSFQPSLQRRASRANTGKRARTHTHTHIHASTALLLLSSRHRLLPSLGLAHCLFFGTVADERDGGLPTLCRPVCPRPLYDWMTIVRRDSTVATQRGKNTTSFASNSWRRERLLNGAASRPCARNARKGMLFSDVARAPMPHGSARSAGPTVRNPPM